MVFRPAFPNRFGPGTANEEVLNQGWPGPIPPRIWTGDTASAKLLLPGQLQAAALAGAGEGVAWAIGEDPGSTAGERHKGVTNGGAAVPAPGAAAFSARL